MITCLGDRLRLKDLHHSIAPGLVQAGNDLYTVQKPMVHATPMTQRHTHVAKLRKKIEDDPGDPQHLITVHRLGYKFVG